MKPFIDKKYLLEKFPGKGGWTFVRIPKTLQNKKSKSAKIKGTIDNFEIKQYHLMPMGDGNLFLPVKAEIRKKIKKNAGDFVHVILFPDTEHLEVPNEMLICLQEEPKALNFFNSLRESEQKYYINWIYSAKKEETRVDRLAKSINKLLKGMKIYDQEKK